MERLLDVLMLDTSFFQSFILTWSTVNERGSKVKSGITVYLNMVGTESSHLIQLIFSASTCHWFQHFIYFFTEFLVANK